MAENALIADMRAALIEDTKDFILSIDAMLPKIERSDEEYKKAKYEALDNVERIVEGLEKLGTVDIDKFPKIKRKMQEIIRGDWAESMCTLLDRFVDKLEAL